jgi:hypothetical protein
MILSSYRVSTGDFNQFIKNLDDALKYLYKPKVELLIFGYINTDYLIEKKIASLLTTYNLLHTVNFATRIQNNSKSATDNILVDNTKISLSSVFLLINGL